MRALSTALFLLAGVANLLPVMGVASAGRLEALYGISFSEPNLLVLMRHRALLLGLVGGLVVASAFQPSLRPSAFVLGLASMLSFVALAGLVGGLNGELRRVVLVDLVASAALVAAALLGWLARTSPAPPVP